jgi:AraC-like DNA-binding protein
LNETDIYRELAPPPALRGAVACFWIRRGDGAPVRVLPDACSDIVWRSGREPVVAGPDTRAWLSETTAGETLVGMRLAPGAGGSALGIPLHALRDERVSLAELRLGPWLRLAGAGDPGRAYASIVSTAAALVAARPPDLAVQAAAARLRDPLARVERLADELGFSERQLRRRFLAAVGYGPKTLQRVLRLRSFLAGAGAGGELAAAALDAGYADQSHLARECRALTGLTAAQLTAARLPAPLTPPRAAS